MDGLLGTCKLISNHYAGCAQADCGTPRNGIGRITLQGFRPATAICDLGLRLAKWEAKTHPQAQSLAHSALGDPQGLPQLPLLRIAVLRANSSKT